MPNPFGKATYGTQGWNAIYGADIDILNARFTHPVEATDVMGTQTVADVPALTSSALTDASGGTTDQTVSAVTGTGDDATINNNFAELVDEFNKIQTEVTNLRTTLNTLLTKLRKTGGCGVLAN